MAGRKEGRGGGKERKIRGAIECFPAAALRMIKRRHDARPGTAVEECGVQAVYGFSVRGLSFNCSELMLGKVGFFLEGSVMARKVDDNIHNQRDDINPSSL